MKIVKFRNLLKALSLFIVLISITFVFSNSMSFGLLKKTNKNRREENSDKPNKLYHYNEAPNKSVYYEGWIKYLHYTEKEKDKAKAFFKNSNYHSQEKNPKYKNLNKNDKVFIDYDTSLIYYNFLKFYLKINN